jgi:hypothetical protein
MFLNIMNTDGKIYYGSDLLTKVDFNKLEVFQIGKRNLVVELIYGLYCVYRYSIMVHKIT